MNKIKIITPKISLINDIGSPPNYPRKYTLSISESGENIHLENGAIPTMPPLIIPNNMTASIPDGNTM